MRRMIEVGERALLTLDNWFYAPDGKQYRAVFGTVHAVRSDAETLGIKTNARSTNWYVEIGNMTIAGCQVHYAIRCDAYDDGEVEDFAVDQGVARRYKRPSLIFNADTTKEHAACAE